MYARFVLPKDIDRPMKKSCQRIGIVRLMCGAFAFVCDPSLADPIDDLIAAIRESVKNDAAKITPAYAAMINFESEPNISSSTLWIDTAQETDDKLKVVKFPMRYEFDLTESGWKPFAQATLAKLSYEQTQDLSGVLTAGEAVSPTWDSYSATLGGGVRIPIAHGWSILPAIDGGYAHLSNETEYSGQFSNTILKPAFEGIISDWSADAWLLNGHLALQYRGYIRKLDIDAKLSYTLSHTESFSSTSEFQEFSESFQTISLKIEGTHPLGISPMDYPLSIIGRLGNSTFLGENRDELEFTYLNEVGLSLQADISKHGLPVKKLSLGTMALLGDNVLGWSILFGYRF